MPAGFLTIMAAESSAKVFRIALLFSAKALDALAALASQAVRNRRPCLSSPQQRRDCRRGVHPQQQRLLRRGSACARRWGNAGVGALQKALTHFCSTVQAILTTPTHMTMSARSYRSLANTVRWIVAGFRVR